MKQGRANKNINCIAMMTSNIFKSDRNLCVFIELYFPKFSWYYAPPL